jgi:hypothetical protein
MSEKPSEATDQELEQVSGGKSRIPGPRQEGPMPDLKSGDEIVIRVPNPPKRVDAKFRLG